jgi:hypothetical protein
MNSIDLSDTPARRLSHISVRNDHTSHIPNGSALRVDATRSNRASSRSAHGRESTVAPVVCRTSAMEVRSPVSTTRSIMDG